MAEPDPQRTLDQALTTLIAQKAARDGEHTVTDQAIGEHIGKSRTTVWKLRTGQELATLPVAAVASTQHHTREHVPLETGLEAGPGVVQWLRLAGAA